MREIRELSCLRCDPGHSRAGIETLLQRDSSGDSAGSWRAAAASHPRRGNTSPCEKRCLLYEGHIFTHHHRSLFPPGHTSQCKQPGFKKNSKKRRKNRKKKPPLVTFSICVFPFLGFLATLSTQCEGELSPASLGLSFHQEGRPAAGPCPSFRAVPAEGRCSWPWPEIVCLCHGICSAASTFVLMHRFAGVRNFFLLLSLAVSEPLQRGTLFPRGDSGEGAAFGRMGPVCVTVRVTEPPSVLK